MYGRNKANERFGVDFFECPNIRASNINSKTVNPMLRSEVGKPRGDSFGIACSRKIKDYYLLNPQLEIVLVLSIQR